MTPKMKKILDNLHKYNMKHIANVNFGLAEDVDSIIQLGKTSNYEIKKASVFCTDSIAMEYTHLEEIKSFDTDLIEMETSTFYSIARLMEIPAIALLVVSDNSATGVPLVGRSEEIQKRYEYSRKVVLIELIYRITTNRGYTNFNLSLR